MYIFIHTHTYKFTVELYIHKYKILQIIFLVKLFFNSLVFTKSSIISVSVSRHFHLYRFVVTHW